jgi:Tfp pilus assembly pilus retraction ATPase PilT
MKTTVDIPKDLFEEAKRVAAAERTTLRSLLQEGLRWVLAQRRRPRKFRLKDCAVSGKGVQPGIREGAWEQIRDLIYQGRGT